MPKSFTTEPMSAILAWAEKSLEQADTFSFEVLNPDVARGSYAGEALAIEGSDYLYRSYKAWNDLAELLFCRLLTPQKRSEYTVLLTFEKIDRNDSFHRSEEKEEKYGTASHFSRIRKNEEPAFLSAYLRALRSVRVGEKKTDPEPGDQYGGRVRADPPHRAGGDLPRDRARRGRPFGQRHQSRTGTVCRGECPLPCPRHQRSECIESGAIRPHRLDRDPPKPGNRFQTALCQAGAGVSEPARLDDPRVPQLPLDGRRDDLRRQGPQLSLFGTLARHQGYPLL